MRRLLNTFDHGEMVDLSRFLEDKGILIQARLVGANYYPAEWAIDVCLDHQFDDAVSLLKNSDHRVAAPVDTEQLHVEVLDGGRQAASYTLRFFAISVVALLVVALALVFYSGAA